MWKHIKRKQTLTGPDTEKIVRETTNEILELAYFMRSYTHLILLIAFPWNTG